MNDWQFGNLITIHKWYFLFLVIYNNNCIKNNKLHDICEKVFMVLTLKWQNIVLVLKVDLSFAVADNSYYLKYRLPNLAIAPAQWLSCNNYLNDFFSNNQLHHWLLWLAVIWFIDMQYITRVNIVSVVITLQHRLKA